LVGARIHLMGLLAGDFGTMGDGLMGAALGVGHQLMGARRTGALTGDLVGGKMGADKAACCSGK
jgi:hypothetical protein